MFINWLEMKDDKTLDGIENAVGPIAEILQLEKKPEKELFQT